VLSTGGNRVHSSINNPQQQVRPGAERKDEENSEKRRNQRLTREVVFVWFTKKEWVEERAELSNKDPRRGGGNKTEKDRQKKRWQEHTKENKGERRRTRDKNREEPRGALLYAKSHRE